MALLKPQLTAAREISDAVLLPDAPEKNASGKRAKVIRILEDHNLGLEEVIPQLAAQLYSTNVLEKKFAVETLLKLHDAMPKEENKEIPSINIIVNNGQNLMNMLLPVRT